MPQVEFFVPGLPVGQPRHKKVGIKGKHAHAYIPGKHPIHAWKALAADIANQNRHEHWPIRKPHPVWVSLDCRTLRPASLPKRVIYWTTTPDRDNIEKGLTDSFTGIVMESDSQIVGGEVTKCYAAVPGVMVRIEWEGDV